MQGDNKILARAQDLRSWTFDKAVIHNLTLSLSRENVSHTQNFGSETDNEFGGLTLLDCLVVIVGTNGHGFAVLIN